MAAEALKKWDDGCTPREEVWKICAIWSILATSATENVQLDV